MFGLLHRNPRKRKFKVSRGDQKKIALELNLSPGHVSKVANGHREGGISLIEKLTEAEKRYGDARLSR